MSLVVARQSEEEIHIVSETKLTDEYHEAKPHKNDPREGAIKSIIINDYTCISFAGNTVFAGEAFKQIQPNSSLPAIIRVLKEYHNLSAAQTEFILCSLSPQPVIYQFKNRQSEQVQAAWIGDLEAYNLFQSYMLTEKRKAPLKNILIRLAITKTKVPCSIFMTFI